MKHIQLPKRSEDGHKGSFGLVLVIGGSEDMIGAPSLAGVAALRMGAGLVKVAAPRKIIPAILTIFPELVGVGLTASPDKTFLDSCEAADAIVVGPGLDSSASVRKLVMEALRFQKPMVIDAGALNILASLSKWPRGPRAGRVLTPHPGEMLRLAKHFGESKVPVDKEGRIRIAKKAALAFKHIVVLKGHETIVTDGNQVYVNDTGDSSLAKAGTGDVLSGMLGTLLAQKMNPYEAACLAVRLHGRAGELAGAKFGKRSVIASEVATMIAAAISEHEVTR